MKRHYSVIIAALLASLILAACGGALPMRSLSEPAQAPMAEESFELAAEPEMAAPAEGMAADSAQRGGEFQLDSVQERLVIRNANLTVVVEDPAESVEQISEMAEEMGGFVVSSSVFETTFGDSRLQEPVRAEQASITIRVPSERLDEALDRIKDGAVDVENQNITGQDVTEEFTDLQSRLRNLEAAEEQLREIMASATKTEDVLQVLDQLNRTREEIEVIRGRMEYLQESARLSSISVELRPDVAAQPLQIGRWSPEGTAKEALEALVGALQFLGDAAIWTAICILPIGVIVGVPAWFAFRAIRRRRRAKAGKSPDGAEGQTGPNNG